MKRIMCLLLLLSCVSVAHPPQDEAPRDYEEEYWECDNKIDMPEEWHDEDYEAALMEDILADDNIYYRDSHGL